MTVLVYGLGRSGLAVSHLLVEQGHTLLAYDAKPKEPEVNEIQSLQGNLVTSLQSLAADVCIAAPGVPYDHPDLISLRQRNIETIGEVEWVQRTIPATLLGITGTAGKTTVTRWLADTLIHAGLPAKAGGNIDPALSAVAKAGDILVTELSSFQLERCPTLKPKIAIVTNLSPDHIDRHGSTKNYFETKRNIIKNQNYDDVFIYNLDDPVLCSWAKSSPAKTLRFSVKQKADAYLENKNLVIYNQQLMPSNELKQSSRHQITNALAVALAAKELGISNTHIAESLRQFEGVEGRYAVVKTIQGVTFIEDSIATRTIAVKAALEATAKPIVWIGGGVDKGATFEELESLVREKVSLFLGIGQDGEMFARHLEGLTQTAFTNIPDGKEALEWACLEGLKHLKHHQGGTILLAPLAASFDQFKDYKDRAKQFRQVVEQLGVNHG
jgi:UDP-N-acetylmuramoylalanine--D-glutamate ligase